MATQIARLGKTLLANIALERFHAAVLTKVVSQIALPLKDATTVTDAATISFNSFLENFYFNHLLP